MKKIFSRLITNEFSKEDIENSKRLNLKFYILSFSKLQRMLSPIGLTITGFAGLLAYIAYLVG